MIAEEGSRAHAKLVHVRLSQERGARIPESLGRSRVVGGRETGQGRGCGCRGHARRAKVILGSVGDAI